MRNSVLILILFLVFASSVYILSCSSEPQPTLSELMRERESDLKLLKAAIENDELIDLPEFVPFIDGIPSRENLETDSFRAELAAFDIYYSTLSQQEAETIKDRYTAVVQFCITCHQRHCPGPIRAIRNLEFEPVDEPGLILFD